jgi:hypothetical protein
MDTLFWHHDAAGFLALAVVAWAMTVVAAVIAARLEEREAAALLRARAQAATRLQRGPAQPFTKAGTSAAGSIFA